MAAVMTAAGRMRGQTTNSPGVVNPLPGPAVRLPPLPVLTDPTNGTILTPANFWAANTVVITNQTFLGWDTNIVHVIGAGTNAVNTNYYRLGNNRWTNGTYSIVGSPGSGTANLTNSSGIYYTSEHGVEGVPNHWTNGAAGKYPPPYVFFHRRYSQTVSTNYFYGPLTNISETFFVKPTLVAIVGDSRCGIFPTWNYAGTGDTNDTSVGGTIQLGLAYPLFKFNWTSALIYQYVNVAVGGSLAEDALTQYTNYVHAHVVGNNATNSIVVIRSGTGNLGRGDTGLATFSVLTNIAHRVVADGGIPILLTCESRNISAADKNTDRERDNLNCLILGSGYRVADSAAKFDDMSSLSALPSSIDGIHLGTNAERQVALLVDGAMRRPGMLPFSANPKTAATQLYPNTFLSHQVYGSNISVIPIGGVPYLTNIAKVIMYGAGTTAANGVYTNWPALASALGVQVAWTNGGTGYWGVYDPNGAIAQNNILEFYTGPGPGATALYDSVSGFIPLTPSQGMNVDNGTSPGPTLIGLPANYANQVIAVYDSNAAPVFSVSPAGLVSGIGNGLTFSGLTGATNGTPPSTTNLANASFVNHTNSSGRVGKIPVFY